MSYKEQNTQPNNYKRGYQSDEINLEDIFFMIIHRKGLIISIIILTLILGALFRIMLPPVYVSHSMIRIGKIKDIFLEDPLELMEKVKQKFNVGENKKLPCLESISLGNNSHNIIFLSTKGKTPEEARDYLKKVIYFVIKAHQDYFDSGIEFQKRRFNSLQFQINQTNNNINLVDKQIKRISGRDNTTASILILEKSGLNKELADLDYQLADVEFILSDLSSRPTQVLQEPTFAKMPKGLSLIQYYINTMIIAIILGMFGGFLAEFFHNLKINFAAKNDILL